MSVQESIESISVKELIGKAVNNWYLFAISLGILLPLAFLHTQTLVPSYEIQAKMSLADKSTDQMASSKKGFNELVMLDNQLPLEDKIQLLKSYSLVKRTVSELPFEVCYYKKKTFSSLRIYEQSGPFTVLIDSAKPQLVDVPIRVEQTNQGYKLSFEIKETASINNLRSHEKVRTLGGMKMEIHSDLDGKIVHDFINVQIIPNLSHSGEFEEDYSFKIRSLNAIVNSMIGGLEISAVNEESSVISLTMSSPMPFEQELFLNHLMKAFILNEEDKLRKKGLKTVASIEEDLRILEDSLNRAQNLRAGVQGGAAIANIGSAQAAIQGNQFTLRSRIGDLRIEQQRYQDLLQSMRSTANDPYAVIPSTQASEDVVLGGLLNNWGILVEERASMARTLTENSPRMQEYHQRILDIRQQIILNIEYRLRDNQIAQREINSQLRDTRQEIASVTRKEVTVSNLEDKADRILNQYDYLSTKMSEIKIAIANLDVSYFILDEARHTGAQSGTSKGMIMIIAMIAGMGLPIGYILLANFFNDSLLTYKELRNHTRIPILGMIIKNDTPYPTLRPDTTDSALAECFRALRIHLYKNVPDEARDKIRTIGVVSTWSGEGKSFCAANTAASLAMAGYKTLIIDLDLRNPNQTRHFDYEPERGISNTLPGARKADITHLLQPTHIPSLDIVAAGPVYHNPLDLFDGPAFKQLVEQAREKYDYVIFDLPPIAQASDYLLVSEFLDYTVYVARHHVTKVSDLERINELHDEGKINYIGLIMNGVANPSYFRYGDMSYYNIGRYKSRYNSAYTTS